MANTDEDMVEMLRAIGRAIEEQARTTRYVMTAGFVVVALILLLFV